MSKRTYIELGLICVIVVLILVIIYDRPKPPTEVIKPVIIDRTDTIRIEKIKHYINNNTYYTHEREIIYSADSTRLDSVLDAQLREIAKRGW